jgi:hypothetical protein
MFWLRLHFYFYFYSISCCLLATAESKSFPVLSESTKLTVYAVHRLLNGRVSVPEVYGWRTDGEEKLIYMQYRASLWKRPGNR